MAHTLPMRPASTTSYNTGSGSVTNYDQILASWSKAVDIFNSQLTRDEKKKIDTTSLQAPFSDLLASASSVKSKVEDARYPWTPTLRRVVETINRYAVIGDLISQHHAEYTSLFAAEEQKTSEKLTKGLDIVTQCVFRAEEYAKLFSTPADSTTDRVFENLHENLTYLYAEVLSLLVRASAFYQKRTLHRFVSAGISSDTKFQEILDKINEHEKNVEKNKNLLEAEARKRQEERENGMWLQAADFEADLKRRMDDHVADTCQWFLTRNEFTRLKEEASLTSPGNRFLWVTGKPGCGKSTLATQIIKDLEDPARIVCYVFCKAGQVKRNTLDDILRNLIFQLLQKSGGRPHWHRMLLVTRQTEKKDSVECTEALWMLLERMLQDEDELYFVLDGIDECHCSKSNGQAFVARVADVFQRTSAQARLISISQFEPEEVSLRGVAWSIVSVQAVDVKDDIKKITSSKFDDSKVLSAHPERERLLRTIEKNSEGMILWATLMVRELELGHWNPSDVLQRPPRGLSPLYESILRRILHGDVGSCRRYRAIGSVLVAARPLTVNELALSIAVREGLQSHKDYDVRGDPTSEAERIVAECRPLLTIMPDATVQVAHSSIKEVLLRSDSPLVINGFSFIEAQFHLEMISTVLKYMTFDCFTKDLEIQLLHQHYLIEYASLFLCEHCLKTVDPEAKTQLANFLETTPGWNWIRRLNNAYGISMGHLQLWQSKLSLWAQGSVSKEASAISKLLYVTSQRRFAESTSLPETKGRRRNAIAFLALVHHFEGRFEEACRLREQLLEICKHMFEDDHPNVITALNNLALTYRRLGRLDEAAALLEESHEKRRRSLGDNHLDTLRVMNNIAAIYLERGHCMEAEKLSNELIEVSTRVLEKAHPTTLRGMQRLARSYRGQKRLNEAEALGKEIVDARKRVLGEEHPKTLVSMSDLALTYSYSGRFEEAEKLRALVMQTQKQVLGEEHPNTLTSMKNLARTYKSQKRFNDAQKLQELVVRIQKRVLGPEHPVTLEGMRTLASIDKSQERFEDVK